MAHVVVTEETSIFKSTETLGSENGHYKSFSSDLLADKVAMVVLLVQKDPLGQVDERLRRFGGSGGSGGSGYQYGKAGLLDLLDCLVALEDKWDYDTVLPVMDTMGLLDNPVNLQSNN